MLLLQWSQNLLIIMPQREACSNRTVYLFFCLSVLLSVLLFYLIRWCVSLNFVSKFWEIPDVCQTVLQISTKEICVGSNTQVPSTMSEVTLWCQSPPSVTYVIYLQLQTLLLAMCRLKTETLQLLGHLTGIRFICYITPSLVTKILF